MSETPIPRAEHTAAVKSCEDCGAVLTPADWLDFALCQMCWEAECDASWWRMICGEPRLRGGQQPAADAEQSEPAVPVHATRGKRG